MGKLSREKGKLGEREVVHLIEAAGFTAERSQQHRGRPDAPDVLHSMRDLRPAGHSLFVEVKRREAINLYDTLDKAEEEMPHGDTAVVFHRRDRKEWLVTMRADEFLDIIYSMHNFSAIEGEI